ncbi:MAG TPA: protein kinase [Planctomycetota bacterium]|nr:protein kinase [Planctomycetota bacterium]
MAKLVIRNGNNTGAEYPLKDARVSLGRRSQSTIPIADAKSSREHAQITDVGGTLFLQDLSRNGTFLNDNPALKSEPGSELKFGDRIKIGDTEFELIDEKSEPITIDIPGYTIIEKVGTGGMGVVYKARQLSMDRVVALKVLNERYSNNAEFVDRFIREARAAGKLNHPNVIHVHDISRANGRHYFSMEYIDGPTVRELLKSDKKIEVNKALDIIMQAAKALEFAHENRIVHRDIKPDNLMLTKEGIVKIADLGIAKTFEEGASGSKEQRGVLGTPHYMSPEQALGKAIDHRADVYSLGATFYHMITGQTPFSGTTAQEILKAHVSASLSPIQELAPGVPDPVCFIIERMMAKLPEKRYQNMSKLIEDIERIQSGQVKGIERIDATDSSILRAVKIPAAKESTTRGAATTVRARPRRPSFSELATGAHSPVGRVAAAVFWLALFAAAIWAVIALPKYLGTKTEPEARKPEKGVKASEPKAAALVLLAKAALDRGDLDEADRDVLEVRTKYQDSKEFDEANRLFDDLSARKRESANARADKLLAEAKKLEAAAAPDSAAILAKYTEALNAAGGNPVVAKEAKAKIEELKNNSLTIKTNSNFSLPAQEAFDKAAALRASFDYDGARKILKEIMFSSQNLEDGAEARKLLNTLDDEAKAKIKEFKDRTAAMDPRSAAAEWGKYKTTVKDDANAAELKPIFDDLEEKTQTVAMEDIGKASALAKANQYADATEAAKEVERKWAGLKWAKVAKAKEESYKQQKDLYDNFLKLLAEKVAAGPLALSFPIQTKFKAQAKWSVTGVRDESITLDPIPKTAAPGVTVKLGELQPKEQYQLVLAALPKEPTKEQHAQLKAFCTERGLADEADMHEKKAGEGN